MFEFLSNLLTWFVKEFGLPAIHDKKALQEWLLKFLRLAASLAKWIPGQSDDRFVALAVKVVGDEEAWEAIHGWILAEFGGLVMSDGGTQDQVARDIAQSMGIDVQDVLDFLKWLIGIIETLFGR